MNKNIVFIAFLILLSACNSPPAPTGVKIGKPYSIGGKRYYPEHDPDYDKIGVASWYGPGFHGKYTANGEIYDQDDLTAAHPTLPMPSIVRVTNLQTGKSLVVRINDRGPFTKNRIIDLSKKSAQELGIHSIAEVRVEFLRDETEQYLASNGITMPASMSRRTKNEPRGQIVEASESSSSAGQIVSNAAPVVSVNAGDLAGSASAPSQEAQPVRLIRQAWADDNVSLPQPPAEITPLVTNEPKPEPSLSPSSGSPGQYYIQVGSFSAEENARKISSRLSDIGAADIGQVEAGGKSWWRVRLGPFINREDADNALGKARSAGAADARMVRL